MAQVEQPDRNAKSVLDRFVDSQCLLVNIETLGIAPLAQDVGQSCKCSSDRLDLLSLYFRHRCIVFVREALYASLVRKVSYRAESRRAVSLNTFPSWASSSWPRIATR